MANSAQIIIDSVSVNNPINQNQTITVAWRLSDASQEVEGYILSILKDEKSIRNYVSEKTNDTFEVPNKLFTANTAYQLQMWYRGVDGTTSSGSTPVPLIIDAPTISSAEWVQ